MISTGWCLLLDADEVDAQYEHAFVTTGYHGGSRQNQPGKLGIPSEISETSFASWKPPLLI